MSDLTIQQAIDLALEHERAGRLAEAKEIVQRIRLTLLTRPADLHSFAIMLGQAGWLAQAAELLAELTRLLPNDPVVFGNLGYALYQLGRLQEAANAYHRAIALAPTDGLLHVGLGNVLLDSGLRDNAVSMLKRATELVPNLPAAHTNLGLAYQRQGRMEESIAAHQAALKLDPSIAGIWNHLAKAQALSRASNDAIESYRRASALDPNDRTIHSNLLFTLYQDDAIDPLSLLNEHFQWADRFAGPLAALIRRHVNDRRPDRVLRIGYLSPDLRDTPVGAFMLPILRSHNRKNVQVFCYCDSYADDEVTGRLRAKTDVWRITANLPDDRLAETIIADQIDILIDLALHSADNRMTVFARKPAPVQVTYLGYPGTTGLKTFDARLGDPYLDPPGSTEQFYSEPTVRLPETYWCYEPTENISPVTQPPALGNGYITFGCLNKLAKVSDRCLEVWREILRRRPTAHILLFAPHGTHRQRLSDFFAKAEVDPCRIELIERQPFRDYLAQYNRIDIALDPFPWNGGTTSCHALWMSVPMITLAGRIAVQRAGVSLLSNVELADLIATSPDEYVDLATKLAADEPRRVSLRASLRQTMENSPLMDVPRFVGNLEKIYRNLWHAWCEKGE